MAGGMYRTVFMDWQHWLWSENCAAVGCFFFESFDKEYRCPDLSIVSVVCSPSNSVCVADGSRWGTATSFAPAGSCDRESQLQKARHQFARTLVQIPSQSQSNIKNIHTCTVCQVETWVYVWTSSWCRVCGAAAHSVALKSIRLETQRDLNLTTRNPSSIY
jgi:hypothetical protein